MAEGYINLFINEHEGTNRPHYRALFKIDGVEHEAAFWPAKEGKKGFSGKYKPKVAKEVESNVTQADADKVWADAEKLLQPKPVPVAEILPDEKIPF